MSSRAILFLIFSFHIFSIKIVAQQQIILAQNQAKYDLENTVIDIFEDPTAKLTFEEIQHQKFMRGTLRNINSGYTNSKMWYRVNVRNESDKKWVFIIFGTLIDEIELFEIKANGNIEKRISGDYRPFSTREIDSPVFGFHIDIPQNQTQTMYLGIKIKTPLSLHYT
jgi:7TMR-DISM extracellular 2